MFVDDWGIFSNGAGGRVLVAAICPRFIGLPLARGAPAAASKAMTEDCFILTVLSLVYNLVTRADSRGDLYSILPVLEQNGEKQVISTCKAQGIVSPLTVLMHTSIQKSHQRMSSSNKT